MLLPVHPSIHAVNRTLVERLAPLIVVVAAVAAGVHAMDPSPVGVFYDDAHYVILGQSLAQGDGYRYLNLPGAPVATHFPPGYPAVLAVLWLISPEFPGNIALFKMTNALLLGVVALATFWASRRLLSARWPVALLVAAASTVTIPALVLSSAVMSEVLFLALLIPLLVVAESAIERDGPGRAAALGAAAGILFLVRSHAIVLIVALALGYASRRRYREAAVAVVVAVLAVSPWLLWVRHYDPLVPDALRGQYGSYGSWLAEGLRQGGAGVLGAALRDNLLTTRAIVARSFSVAENAAFDAIAVLAVGALLVAGTIALARRARVTLIFLAAYMATVLFWPFSPLRFVWGVWPLLVLTMVGGAAFLIGTTTSTQQGRGIRITGIAVSAIALIGACVFNVRGYANEWWGTVSRSVAPRIQPQLVWTSEHTDSMAIIASDDEGAVFLYTGRRAVPANVFTVDQYFRARPAQENAQRLEDILRATSADYVIAWARPTLDAAALLAARQPAVLTQVDTIPTGKVYRRN